MRRAPHCRQLGALVSAALAAGALAVDAREARADGGDAQTQFDYGLAEMTAGRYATGCPALEMSFRVDPRPGTLFTVAECQLKWGHTASALASYSEYLAVYDRMSPEQKAKQGQRPTIAAAKRTELSSTVPRLTVTLPPGAEVPPFAIVSRDDVTLTGPLLGEAIPVDPGDHVVRVTLPDGRSRETRVSVAAGEQRSIVVELPPPAKSAPVGPPADGVPSPPQRRAPPASPSAPPQCARRVFMFASAGVGIAAVAVSAVTGGLALADKSTASLVCSGNVCSSQAGADAGNGARSLANVDTVAAVVAGAALVTAAILWLTAPSRLDPASAAGVSFSPLGVGGQW